MIDPILIIYVAIVLLALGSSWALLHWRGGLRDKTLAKAMVVIKAVLIGEQIYYGAGRLWPDRYEQLSLWMPGVLIWKIGYVVSIALVLLALMGHEKRMEDMK